MPIIYPKDESGTEFDPSIHNILDETLEPQLSQKGNFVRLRDGQSNSDEVLDQYFDKLSEKQASEEISDNDLGLAGIAIEDDDKSESSSFVIDDPVEEEPEPVEVVKEQISIIATSSTTVNGDAQQLSTMIISMAKGANFTEPRGKVDFSGADYDFSGVDLSKADLRGVIFRGCILDKANFTGANCEGADFRGCSLKGAIFDGANLNFTFLPMHPQKLKKQASLDIETTVQEVSY